MGSASRADAPGLLRAGVELYRHERGSMHQKVVLVDDDDLATVGSANFDNRSFRLNSEITMEVRNAEFATKVEQMIVSDFADARLVADGELEKRSFLYRFGVKAANLLAPVQ